MSQVILARLGEGQSLSAFSTDYWVPMGRMLPTSDASRRAIWPCAGDFSDLLVTIGTAPGSGKSWTFTLMKNNTATALAVTISDSETAARLTGTVVAFNEGDEISLRITNTGLPDAVANHVWVSMTFEATTAGQSGYASQPFVFSHAADTSRYSGVFASGDWVTAANINGLARNLVGCPGTLDRLYIYQGAVNGAGVTTTYTIYKNGVAQDGSGGTADTRVVIGPGVATGSASFALALVPGDTLHTHVVNTGGAVNTVVAASARFTADVAGEYQWVGCSGAPLTNVDNYWVASGYDGVRTDTETHAGMRGGITAFRVRGLRVLLTTAPGGATSRTFSLRKNGAAISGSPTLTIAGTDIVGSDASGNIADVEDGDVDWVLHSSVDGSPGATNAQWAGIASPIQNLPPVVTLPSQPALTDGTSVVIDAETTVTDPDDTHMSSATVQFINGTYVEGQDVLAFTDAFGLVGSWDADTGILTLTPIDPDGVPIADMQAALRTVTYHNTSGTPTFGTRQIRVTVCDMGGA